MRTSHRLKPYPTSRGTNSTVTRPAAGTSTLRVEMVLPFTTSETDFVSAGVLKPAITACTRERFGSFGSDSAVGASTLSTVQFGGAGLLATGCNRHVTLSDSSMYAKFDGMAVCCMSLNR